MIKVLFVCHGNICRSPMAEFVFRDMVKKRGLSNKIETASAATSTEEIGNPVHRGTRTKLASVGISTEGKYAVRLVKADYDRYDYLVGMDSANIRNMKIMTGGDEKIFKLLEFAGIGRDVADPWYTGDFDATYEDVVTGCTALLDRIEGELDGN
ncbi:MAG: low molecular weight phosphotyrosine protein phosphatase [Oscillospiraceae bacterium]|nr:low molecular weight phosphotyrosine protein phosphatase [Oscillospiraceae bacterium]